MKYLLALVIALGINYSPAVATESETICLTKTQTQFLLEMSPQVKAIHLIEGPELEVFMKNVNEYRIQAGGQAWRANVMLIGELLDGDLGIVLFQDGCKIASSDWAASKENMAKMFESNKSLDILRRLDLMPGEGV